MRNLDAAGEVRQSGEEKSSNIDALDLLKEGSSSQQKGFFSIRNHWNTNLNSVGHLDLDDIFKDLMNQPSPQGEAFPPPPKARDDEEIKLEK